MNYLKKDLLPIQTERLLLRLLEPEETDLMLDYITENREHLRPWEPSRSERFFSPEFWRKELLNRQNDFFLGQGVRLAVFFKDRPKGPVVGICNFTEIMKGAFHACYLGYSVHNEYQGRGVMYEALNAATAFMFDTFNLHRIMANYMPRNERSGTLLRKLGFDVEGYARDYLKINDKWEDHILTAKVKGRGVER